MIARGARLDAARTRRFAASAPPIVPRPAVRAEDRAVVHRLERKLLVVRASSASISAIGVPALAERISSSGS
jgi:hypothetical protein